MPSPNSVVTFACTEEEIKRHERVVGRRIKRKFKAPKTVVKMDESANSKYDVHHDRKHCEYTFGFFWLGEADLLKQLAELADNNGDSKFGSCLATLAATLLVVFPKDATKYARPRGNNSKGSVNTILGLRENHSGDLDFKNFLGIDEEGLLTFDPKTEPYAQTLRNFRATKTFVKFICGLELDASIKIDKVSPELSKLRAATDDRIGDLVFANQYQNHRTGETSALSETSHGERSVDPLKSFTQ